MELTSGQSGDFVVLSDITIEADILEMLADQVSSGVSCTCTLARRLQVIKLLDNLCESFLDELVSWYPRVEPVIEAWKVKA